MDKGLLQSLIEASKKNKPCYTKNTAADYLKFYKEHTKFYHKEQDRRFCIYNNILGDPLALTLIRAGINPLGDWSYGSFLANSKLS